ncbi:MAG: ABC transporter ATP-binding protein [Candidatus Hydrogenedentes bacterium]|nr:ABC transporter ATP-binding protein [Candidatus Hydrogenedentota bacterium]
MIKVVDLVQHYGVRPVLRDINIEIAEGEVVALMGPNGMGKSTLLAAMAGVLWPQKGYIEIDGKRRRQTVDDELAIRKKVVYLPDHPWLPKFNTAREFLLSVGRLYSIEPTRLMEHVQRLLTLFDLDANGDQAIDGLSNGQKKKVAIASALVTEAPIMLLDEPFSGGLDPAGMFALKAVMKQLRDRSDVTVVMATPVPEIVEGLADRVIILRNGELVAFDTPDGLRKLANVTGPLEEVLEHLIDPKGAENISQYLESRKK